MPASRPADIDAIYVGNNGGFEKQDFPASLVLQADPALRFKPATRVENACATGSAAVHQGLDSIAAGRARFVLVVGVEKMTETPGEEVGDILLNASYRKEEGDIAGGFAGMFGRIAQTLFPALRRPVRRAGEDRRQEPQERRRQSACADAQGSRLRILPHRVATRTRSSPARCAAPIARWCRTAPRRWCWPTLETALALDEGGRVPRRRQVNDFLPMSRRDIVAFEGCRNGPGSGPGDGAARPRRSRSGRNA